MIFSIEIVGDELTELMETVSEVNAEDSRTVWTIEQYLTNICMNFLTPRVRGVLIKEAMDGDIEELKKKLGKVSDLKLKQKKRSK